MATAGRARVFLTTSFALSQIVEFAGVCERLQRGWRPVQESVVLSLQAHVNKLWPRKHHQAFDSF
jgi:hypothetical protein